MEAARLWVRGDFLQPTSDDDDDDHPAQDTTDAALAAFGLVLAPGSTGSAVVARDHVFFLFPEHCGVFALWSEVQTQWRDGLNGRTGLDYAGVRAHLELRGTPAGEWQSLHQQLRTMERAALGEWRLQRQRQGQRR